MNGEVESQVRSGISLESVWLCFIRIILVAAWAFNLVIMAATVLRAWQCEDSGRVLGVGFLFIWLLLTGVVVVRTSAPTPVPAPLPSGV
jgi:hypothetical protein